MNEATELDRVALTDMVMRHALSIDADGKHTDTPAPIRFTLNPGDASAEDLAEVLISMSELHRSYGGLGLIFESEGFEFTAREVTPADHQKREE